MADLGTVVGVVSLGIQVCNGLVSYYKEYRGQKLEIDDIIQKAEGLTSAFSLIQQQLPGLPPQHQQVAAQVERLVFACKDKIAMPDEALVKCRQAMAAKGPKEKLLQLKQKLSYPIQRDTLQALQSIIGILQDNVNTAVAALQLNLSREISEQASTMVSNSTIALSASKATLLQVGQMNRDLDVTLPEIQTKTTKLVNDVDRALVLLQASTCDTSRSLQEAKTTIVTNAVQVQQSISEMDRNMIFLSRSITEGFSRFEQNLPKILEEIMLKDLEQRLAHNVGQPRGSDLPDHQQNHDPDPGDCGCQSSLPNSNPETGLQRINILLDQQVIGANEMSLHNVPANRGRMIHRLCACSSKTRRQQHTYRNGGLQISRSTETTHLHDECYPFSSLPKERNTWMITYSASSYVIGGILKFMVAINSGGGDFAISPTLKYFNTVPSTSPAFALLRSSTDFGVEFSKYQRVNDQILQLFRDQEFAPTDRDENGDTLFHLACRLHPQFYNLQSINGYRTFLLTIASLGVPVNERNVEGRHALEQDGVWSRILFSDIIEDACLNSSLLRCGVEFTEANVDSLHHGTPLYEIHLRVLQACRSDDELLDVYKCGPLSKAVLRRSTDQVSQILRTHSNSIHEQNLWHQSPLHLSADWPAGIGLLLSAGGENLIEVKDRDGDIPLRYAVETQCYENVKTLLALHHSQRPSDTSHLGHILYIALQSGSKDIVEHLIHHIADRKRRLELMAKETLSIQESEELHASSQRVLKAMGWDLTWLNAGSTVYGAIFSQVCRCITLTDLANLFYESGFYDIGGYESIAQLPRLIWGNLYELEFYELTRLINWFSEKGSKWENRRYPNGKSASRTPIANFLGVHFILSCRPWRKVRGVLLHKMQSMGNDFNTLLRKVISERISDDCVCACSTHGCISITAMFKAVPYNFPFEPEDINAPISTRKRGLIEWMWKSLAVGTQDWERVASSVIRLETFVKLDLTHTCCKLHDRHHRPLSTEERSEIREEERITIAQLEDLVAEFTAKYTELQVTLLDFLDGYWETRMDEVMADDGDLDNEFARFRQLGISPDLSSQSRIMEVE